MGLLGLEQGSGVDVARKDVQAIIDHAREIIKDSSSDAVYIRLLNIASSELALELTDKDVYRTVSTIGALEDAVTINLDLAVGKLVSVEPVAVTFHGGSDGVRYTPDWVEYGEFQDLLFHDQGISSTKGTPRLWSYQKLAGDEGAVTIHVFPSLDKNYVCQVYTNFYSKSVSDVTDYVPMARILEHLLILGTAYHASRIFKRSISLEYKREFNDALDIFKTAHSDQGGPARMNSVDQDFFRGRPNKGYVRKHGSEPAIAFDNNPAIPYDPANPDEGFPS